MNNYSLWRAPLDRWDALEWVANIGHRLSLTVYHRIRSFHEQFYRLHLFLLFTQHDDRRRVCRRRSERREIQLHRETALNRGFILWCLISYLSSSMFEIIAKPYLLQSIFTTGWYLLKQQSLPDTIIYSMLTLNFHFPLARYVSWFFINWTCMELDRKKMDSIIDSRHLRPEFQVAWDSILQDYTDHFFEACLDKLRHVLIQEGLWLNMNISSSSSLIGKLFDVLHL